MTRHLLLIAFLFASVCQLSSAQGIKTDLTSKELKAAQICSLLNPDSTQSEQSSVMKAIADVYIYSFVRRLDPHNPNWNVPKNTPNPEWQQMEVIVKSDALALLSNNLQHISLSIKTDMTNALVQGLDESEVDMLLQYLQTKDGKRYAELQARLAYIIAQGRVNILRNKQFPEFFSAPSNTGSPEHVKSRMRLLSMSTGLNVLEKRIEIDKKNNHINWSLDKPSLLILSISVNQGDALDNLASAFANDIGELEKFSQSYVSTRFNEAMASTMADTENRLLNKSANIADDIWKSHGEQWQRTYQTVIVTKATAPLTEKLKAGTEFRDCPDCPIMVVVPSGEFDMGSPGGEIGRPKILPWRPDGEAPIHHVKIRSFAVGKFELTRGEYSKFNTSRSNVNIVVTKSNDFRVWASNPNLPEPKEFNQDDNHPVVDITWWNAKFYLAWLSKKTGKTYRLLSEAEWEYAARAGTTTSRYWGDNSDDACRYENIKDITLKNQPGSPKDGFYRNCTDGYAYTAPVGSFKPNPFGLYDMLGNVSEWTEDCVHTNYIDAPSDGSAWTWGGFCEGRVARGGNWEYDYKDESQDRSAYRGGHQASDNTSELGFRIARTLN